MKKFFWLVLCSFLLGFTAHAPRRRPPSTKAKLSACSSARRREIFTISGRG